MNEPLENNNPQPKTEAPAPQAATAPASTQAPASNNINMIQILLGLNGFAVLVILSMSLGIIPNPNKNQQVNQPIAQAITPTKNPHVTSTPPAKTNNSQKSDEENIATGTKKYTLFQARQALKEKRFELAHKIYQNLAKQARFDVGAKFICDFYRLRQAFCYEKQKKFNLAQALFKELSISRSPIIKGYCFYHIAKNHYRKHRYLQARQFAYKALAVLNYIDEPMVIKRNCQYLISRALTEKVRSITNSKSFLNWGKDQSRDPFINLSFQSLRDLLSEGSSKMLPASLGQDIRIRRSIDSAHRYIVSASNVNVESFISNLANRANKNINWRWVDHSPRQEIINVNLRNCTAQRAAEIAAGCAGLISRFDLKKFTIYNPVGDASSKDIKNLLAREAITSWRQFLIRNPGDPQKATGNLALAAIAELTDDKIAAIRQYQIIASQFPKSDAAPQALMRSAQIRISMLDFKSAERDLTSLLDLYPRQAGVDKIYLMIGEINEKQKKWGAAREYYEMLYYRNLSEQSKRISCLGAGRTAFRMQDFASASNWLDKFVSELEKPTSEDFIEAYFLLGKSESARRNFKIAKKALYRCLTGNPEKQTRVAIMFELAKIGIAEEKYANAIGALDKLKKVSLSENETTKWACLYSKVYRDLDLISRATQLLKSTIINVDKPILKQKLTLELARNYYQSKSYKQAIQTLTEIISDMPAGNTLDYSTLLLAKCCNHINKPKQAISYASKLLDNKTSTKVKKLAKSCLAKSYIMLKQYSKAALYFSNLPADKNRSAVKK